MSLPIEHVLPQVVSLSSHHVVSSVVIVVLVLSQPPSGSLPIACQPWLSLVMVLLTNALQQSCHFPEADGPVIALSCSGGGLSTHPTTSKLRSKDTTPAESC